MSQWSTNASESNFQIGERVQEAIDNRGRDAVDASQGSISTNQYGNDDIVGINAKKIPNIQANLRLYIREVEKVYNQLPENINTHYAIADAEVNKAINAYFAKVREYMKNLTSQLNAFNDKLDSVREQWESSEIAQRQQIQESANSIVSEEYKPRSTTAE